MRISTSQLFNRSVQNLLQNQRELSDLQNQLSSGKRILTPSDDPVGSSKVIRLTEEIEQLGQFQRNNDIVSSALEQQESVLRNVVSSVQKAQQLTLQAGNGANSQQDKEAIGAELGQIRDQIFDLMNTRDASGEYIFAGYQSKSPAFIFDPNAATGNRYQFQGDSGRNEFQIATGVEVEGIESGKQTFENVFGRLKATQTAASTGGSLAIKDQGTFDGFHRSTYDGSAGGDNSFQVEIVAGGNVEITSGNANFTGPVVIAANPGETFRYQGMEIQVDGGVGDTLDFDLNKPEKKNLAETIDELVIALNDETLTEGQYREALADASVGLRNGFDAVSTANSAIGGRMKIAESIRNANEDLLVSTKEARSVVEDVNYAEAVSQLSREETALQAAQATFSRVTQLSLFDFI